MTVYIEHNLRATIDIRIDHLFVCIISVKTKYMSNKSFLEIINELKAQDYKISMTEIERYGDFCPEDVDWNDKDVAHLNVVHTKVEGIQAVISEKIMNSIYFQTLPYIGFKIPLIVNSYEYVRFNNIYFTNYGPFILVVNSISELVSDNRTKNTVTFALASKGFLKLFHSVIKKMLIKNNAQLMSEDMPMRERRGVLRKNNHSFFSKTETYSYNNSTDIYRANVLLKENVESFISINKEQLINAEDETILGDKVGIYSFFISIDKNKNKKLWPTTCVHEGAPLNKNCIEKDILICPWHRRKNFPLLQIDSLNKIDFFKHIDYAIKDDGKFIKIRFRNDPNYYDKKPYCFLEY